MVIPTPRDISNHLQRNLQIKKKKLNNVIGDFQDALQFCDENSAHRMTQEQYNALPGVLEIKCTVLFIIFNMFTFLKTHNIIIKLYIRSVVVFDLKVQGICTIFN